MQAPTSANDVQSMWNAFLMLRTTDENKFYLIILGVMIVLLFIKVTVFRKRCRCNSNSD